MLNHSQVNYMGCASTGSFQVRFCSKAQAWHATSPEGLTLKTFFPMDHQPACLAQWVEHQTFWPEVMGLNYVIGGHVLIWQE